jgi:hypothetical protein
MKGVEQYEKKNAVCDGFIVVFAFRGMRPKVNDPLELMGTYLSSREFTDE